jgi:osmotically-inducible protein OsmY
MRFLYAALVLALLIAPVFAQSGKISDDTLVDQVRVRLAGDADVGGLQIDVEAQGGVVTLKGRVRNDKQRTKAEKITKKVKGVSGVVNQLVVSPVQVSYRRQFLPFLTVLQ